MPGDTSLRPYYNHDTFNAGYSVIYKPRVGLIDTETNKEIVSTLSEFLHAGNGSSTFGKVGLNSIAFPRPEQFKSADKTYAYDLELLEYFDLANLQETFKDLVWNFVKNYCKAIFSQPLDIVRLILQVGYFDFSQNAASASTRKSSDNPSHLSSEDELSEEEIDFFQPKTTVATIKPETRKAPVKVPAREKQNFKVQPVSTHTLDVINAVCANDCALAMVRGINASFIYSTLSHTIKAWITGFVSPFLNIPDPFFLDLTHSTEPAKSFWLSVIACVLTGLILMPLDLIKVHLMLTPIRKRSSPETESNAANQSESELTSSINLRSIRDSLRHYPRSVLFNPPMGITFFTIMHQFSTNVFRQSAPYLLFVRYNIDSYLSPALYTTANLVLSITELFLQLPVENMLRKEQVRFLLKPKSREEDEFRVVTIDNPEENLVVEYNGWGKFSHVERGASLWATIQSLRLFSGWRVGVLNIIGYWGYNIFKNIPAMAEERL